MEKAPDAFRTISEVSEWLDTPTHVLRFWESRFPDVAPVKRAGGRRYYRVEDMRLLGGIKKLLHEDGVTIKALQDRIKSDGAASVAALSPTLEGLPTIGSDQVDGAEAETGAPRGPATALPDRASTRASPEGKGASTGSRSDPPVRDRQTTLSFGDDPEPSASQAQGVSFKRHPRRAAAKTNAAPPPKKTKPHPSRAGLFVYDDSELKSPEARQAALGAIDSVPVDPNESIVAPLGVPAAAELRALVVLAGPAMPDGAVEAIARLRSLRERWT